MKYKNDTKLIASVYLQPNFMSLDLHFTGVCDRINYVSIEVFLV